jgi:hypothetical protein
VLLFSGARSGANSAAVKRYPTQMQSMCFLSAADAQRASATLQKLLRHDMSGWALTGGLALEIHCMRGGLPASTRLLNDLDFVTPTFACIPQRLGADFLCRHVHPFDQPGKTILQLVDAEAALRIDVFRAYGAIMTRSLDLEFSFGRLQLISCEDVLARSARLLLDLRGGIPVPAKHSRDYLRLHSLIQLPDMEVAWQDHRKPDHPVNFQEANTLVQDLIAAHRDLLVTPDYSGDVTQTCSRCVPSGAFPLADPSLVLSLLGYC